MKKEQAHAAARRALAEGLKKLEARATALAAPPPAPANNLAALGLDNVVIDLLVRAGFGTKTAVAKATDKQLKAVRGIETARLRQIRHFVPYISRKAAKIEAVAAAGQKALF